MPEHEPSQIEKYLAIKVGLDRDLGDTSRFAAATLLWGSPKHARNPDDCAMTSTGCSIAQLRHDMWWDMCIYLLGLHTVLGFTGGVSPALFAGITDGVDVSSQSLRPRPLPVAAGPYLESVY